MPAIASNSPAETADPLVIGKRQFSSRLLLGTGKYKDFDETRAAIEASGAKLASFITAGDNHTVLSKPDFYTETTNGVKFVDWVTQLINTGSVDDVHCTKCTVG